ncbi:hypothetical protein DIPPA_32095 [Diplonema papillatum]|nr:hypothetical protein DIPPA_32095 [Diplonema papillatum]
MAERGIDYTSPSPLPCDGVPGGSYYIRLPGASPATIEEEVHPAAAAPPTPTAYTPLVKPAPQTAGGRLANVAGSMCGISWATPMAAIPPLFFPKQPAWVADDADIAACEKLQSYVLSKSRPSSDAAHPHYQQQQQQQQPQAWPGRCSSQRRSTSEPLLSNPSFFAAGQQQQQQQGGDQPREEFFSGNVDGDIDTASCVSDDDFGCESCHSVADSDEDLRSVSGDWCNASFSSAPNEDDDDGDASRSESGGDAPFLSAPSTACLLTKTAEDELLHPLETALQNNQAIPSSFHAADPHTAAVAWFDASIASALPKESVKHSAMLACSDQTPPGMERELHKIAVLKLKTGPSLVAVDETAEETYGAEWAEEKNAKAWVSFAQAFAMAVHLAVLRAAAGGAAGFKTVVSAFLLHAAFPAPPAEIPQAADEHILSALSDIEASDAAVCSSFVPCTLLVACRGYP